MIKSIFASVEDGKGLHEQESQYKLELYKTEKNILCIFSSVVLSPNFILSLQKLTSKACQKMSFLLAKNWE